jgi:hypothetical protein
MVTLSKEDDEIIEKLAIQLDETLPLKKQSRPTSKISAKKDLSRLNRVLNGKKQLWDSLSSTEEEARD